MPTECIARNNYYEIAFQPAKNRVYLTITGFWGDPSVVPFYRSDWQKALAQVQPGFTVLADATRMKTHPAPVQALHEAIQRLLQKEGMRLSAKVVALDDMADTELPADLRELLRLAAVGQRRSARDHLQVSDLREPCDDLVLHAIGEIGVRLVLAEVFERQHCDRALRGRLSCARRPRRAPLCP